MNSKIFIQYAWVGEVIGVIVFTFIAYYTSSIDRFIQWIQILPLISALIAAQGGAASIGPLIRKKIEHNGGINGDK